MAKATTAFTAKTSLKDLIDFGLAFPLQRGVGCYSHYPNPTQLPKTLAQAEWWFQQAISILYEIARVHKSSREI